MAIDFPDKYREQGLTCIFQAIRCRASSTKSLGLTSQIRWISKHPGLISGLVLTLLLSSTQAVASCIEIKSDAERLACYESAEPDVTSEDYEPLEARIASENNFEDQRFSIASHKPNYLLPLSYNFNSNFDTYGTVGELFNDAEIKFQLSIKAPFWRGLWMDSSIWLAYTQLSYWQLYADSDASSPFRETNHEPEVIWDFPMDFTLPGKIKAKRAWLGFAHESNGRSEPLSRSWNRITGSIFLEKKRFVVSAKSWIRIKESSSNDDNPNIEDYVGRAQFGIVYKGKHNTLTLNVRNNLRQENRSGYEFSWSRPMRANFKWYIQVYSGYGENLIDMENYSNRLSLGFALTDWL